MARKRRPLTAGAYLRLFGYMTRDEQLLAICALHQVYLSLTKPGILSVILAGLVSFTLGKIGLPDPLVSFLVDEFTDLQRQDLLKCAERLGPPEPIEG